MSHLFGILLRILFPFDKVGRSRELMRVWLHDIMSLVLNPLNTPCFETDAENRTWLEATSQRPNTACRFSSGSAPAR